MKRNKKNKIDHYLDAVVFAFENDLTPGEYWPLKPAQMTAYFEDSLAVDIYERIKMLRKQKVPIGKAAKMFGTPGILRNFLENFANTGLKVAHNTGWYETNFGEREVFFHYLFEVLEEMVENDIFLRDGKQIILKKEEVKNISWDKFIKLDERSSKAVRRFNMALFGLVWSLYFDTFSYTGFSSHGPYKISREKFGIKNGSLVVNDYFNLRPLEIWPAAGNMPFENIRIYNIYKNRKWSINFFERVDPKLSLADDLCFAMIEIDGNIVNDPASIEKITEQIFEITAEQTNFVGKLIHLNIVRKASEICYYGLRSVFDHFKESWKPPKAIGGVIEKFGDKFIKKFDRDLADYPPAKIRKLFDPRNNWY